MGPGSAHLVPLLYTRESRLSPLAHHLPGGSKSTLVGSTDGASQGEKGPGTGKTGPFRPEILLTTSLGVLEETDETLTLDQDETPSMIDLRPLKVNLFGHPVRLEPVERGLEGKGKGREGVVVNVGEKVRGESRGEVEGYRVGERRGRGK